MRLWNFYDGEPFLENPHLTVVNPRRKKGKKTMAVRKRRRTTRRPTRRRRRRNAYPVGGLVTNPRRRRRRASRVASRRRSSYRRNPQVMGLSIPPLSDIAFAGAGFIAPPMVEGFVNQYLPVELTTNTLGRYAVRIGSVLFLSWATKQVIGAHEAKMVAIGGGAYVATSAIAEFMPDMVPGMGAYTTAAPSLGSYTAPNQPVYQGEGRMLNQGNSAVRFPKFASQSANYSG